MAAALGLNVHASQSPGVRRVCCNNKAQSVCFTGKIQSATRFGNGVTASSSTPPLLHQHRAAVDLLSQSDRCGSARLAASMSVTGPSYNINAIQRLSELELEQGIVGAGSWHDTVSCIVFLRCMRYECGV